MDRQLTCYILLFESDIYAGKQMTPPQTSQPAMGISGDRKADFLSQ